jgi:hypothetical protein
VGLMDTDLISVLDKRCEKYEYIRISLKSGNEWNLGEGYDCPWYVIKRWDRWSINYESKDLQQVFTCHRIFKSGKRLKRILKEYYTIFDEEKFKKHLYYHILKDK